jgi:hypothetical protein
MKHPLACIFAIVGWYLLYPPATYQGNPDSYTSLSKWVIDGSYGSAADCDEAHLSDVNALQGLDQNSADFLQTQAGRCTAADDPRLAEVIREKQSYWGQPGACFSLLGNAPPLRGCRNSRCAADRGLREQAEGDEFQPRWRIMRSKPTIRSYSTSPLASVDAQSGAAANCSKNLMHGGHRRESIRSS